MLNDSTYFYDDSILYDTTNTSEYKQGFLNADFFAFHGYALLSSELYDTEKHYFEVLIDDQLIPTVEIQDPQFLAWMAVMRNNLFLNLSWSFANVEREKIDSLSRESKLKQSSMAFKTGYNAIKSKSVVLSPYIGFRFFRLRHVTTSSNSRTSINDYLSNPNIDLRVTQFSAVFGLNSTFTINEQWSVGIYAEYVQHIHNKPILRTKGNRLSSSISTPIGNYVIGVGMGFGLNYIKDDT